MILCCLTLACSAPPDGTTPAATDDDAAAPITAEADASAAATLNAAPAKKCGTKVDVDAPMFLFYGLYDNVGDDPATLELAPTANGEPTVTITAAEDGFLEPARVRRVEEARRQDCAHR